MNRFHYCRPDCLRRVHAGEGVPLSQASRAESSTLVGDVVIRTIPIGGHPPHHPFSVPETVPTRAERAGLLRRLRTPPLGVLSVDGVCDCSFTTPFLDAQPIWDFGLGPHGRSLRPPSELNTPWDLDQLSAVLADLAQALADLHAIGVAHGDAALMNAMVVDQAGTPRGTWVDLGSVIFATDEAQRTDAAAFVLATALPALLCADSGSSSLVKDLIAGAAQGPVALAEALHTPRRDVQVGAAREALVEGLHGIGTIDLSPQLVKVGLRMAPAYFLDQSTGDNAVRFLQQLLRAERTRHALLEEERTRLMYRRFHDELETARNSVAELQDHAMALESAREEAREEVALARQEGNAVAERLESLLQSRAYRITAAVEGGVRTAARARLLMPYVSLPRAWTGIRLLTRGDVAVFRERARELILAQQPDSAAAGLGKRTPVVTSSNPWPSDVPLISVIIVCFNYGLFVEEAIASVLAQTAVAHCEVLVVDGGSTDPETVQKMRLLAARPPPRTRVFLREDGRHLVGDNRNYGIERARGRYVACLDADDLLDPRYLEVALYLLERRGYDVVSSTTQCFGLSDDYFGLPLAPDLSDMLAANCVTTAAVYRRDLWAQAGGYHDAGLGDAYVFEDWKLWVRIAALGARLTNIQAPLFRYRAHSPQSLSKQSGRIRDMATQRASVIAYNADVCTPRALADSKYRRTLFVTVEGAFDNLGVNEPCRPTILLSLPFLLIGGAERLLSSVAKHLSSVGFRIIVVTTLDTPSEFGDSTSWFEETTAEIYHLARLLRQEYWEDFIDYVITTKGVDLLFLAGSEFFYDQLPRIRSRHPNLRVVDLLFNTAVHVRSNRRRAAQIDVHLCENVEVYDWLLANGEDQTSVVLIQSGVDTTEFRPVFRPIVLPLRVGFSGRLAEEKAPLAFVDLAAMLSSASVHLLMTGGGPLEALVRQRTAGLPDAAFSFLGVIDDIKAHLASLDVLVVPSVLDGRPIVVLEALSLGVPVIASRVGALPELIRDGETGFLVHPGDTQAIAQHLQRLANNLDELRALRTNARAFAERELDVAVMNEAYEQTFRGLLRGLDSNGSAACAVADIPADHPTSTSSESQLRGDG